MRTYFWRLTSVIILLTLLISPLGPVSAAPAKSQLHQQDTAQPGMQVVKASFVGVSRPLRTMTGLKTSPPEATGFLTRMQDRFKLPKALSQETGGGLDASIVQTGPVLNRMPAANANFEGVNNISGVLPPDTQGDIGADPVTGTKYYVQWVNLNFQIWDVTSPTAPVSLFGPVAGNTLWAGTGTICDSNNDGDPITLFDHLANRWMMSQFALSFPNNFHQCIAVSQTADPTGAWYLYDFKTSSVNMNDYPHFGVWPDGYYMSVNQFNGSTFNFTGAGVAVFERSAMLLGLPATMIYINTGAVTNKYGGMLPSDLDGPGPAAGTPNYFMEWDDSTWLSDPADTLRIWEFKTDWSVPTNSTFGLNSSYDPNLMIATANVDPDISGIPQPGTSQVLDTLSDRLMYRLQYRDFGSYQTLVGNHTVDANGADKAGIHWFELRDSGSGFALNQQGVYAPDEDNRWMASAAMDISGDIALGFSASNSTTTYPSIRYTGRLSADPAGSMPQGEATLIAGSGHQTHPAARWGDYSMLSVDPVDNCTFWYTNEYIQTSGTADWQTRIGSFKFPSCTPLPVGIISGTVSNSSSVPIAGASVTFTGGSSTVTDSAGYYQINLPAGSYDISVSKYGYISGGVTGITVTPPAGITQNFQLATAPRHTISGVVSDATTGWPLYARLDIHGYPESPVFTNPVTGAYSLNLFDAPYTFTVTPMSGGYQDDVLSLTLSSNITQNFDLAVDLFACSAPGYQTTSPDMTEDFEAWPPTGWTIVDNIPSRVIAPQVQAPGVNGGGGGGGASGLIWNTSTFYTEPNFTGGTGEAATVASEWYFGDYDTELITSVIDPAALTYQTLSYKANYQKGNLDSLDLDIKNVGDAGWTNILNWAESHGTAYSTPGETVGVDLSTYITGNFQLRWHLSTPEMAPYDLYAEVDDVALGAGCIPMASSGLVVGAVYDLNTGLPAKNPVVHDASDNQAQWIDASADPAAGGQIYVLAQPSGPQTLTAAATNYGTDSNSPVVPAGGTIRQDFHLPAGRLSTSPVDLSFVVNSLQPADSKPLTVFNSGGLSANYEIFAIPGTYTIPTPTGPFAAHTRHFGPMHLNDRDASAVRTNFTHKGVSILSGGNVLNAWPTNLAYAWGIGFNIDNTDLWLGNLLGAGGDGFNYRFTTDGTNTGDAIDTNSWVSAFNADMTYDPFTNKLWQVNVGGDNCIYELDPAAMLSTGSTICPAFGTSERGLAFDPLTNTFYSGSWNDGILNHFAADGTILDSYNVGLGIAGLAFNPSTGHLFVMAAASGPDIFVLDTNSSYDIIGAFYVKDSGAMVFNGYGQAGLEIDCDGNLWAVNQSTQMVYKFASGETGACDYTASWLSASPATGSIAGANQTLVNARVDATGLDMGTYNAYLRVVGNTPYGDSIVPVSLAVQNAQAFTSQSANDGWLLESKENSNVGSGLNYKATVFRVGDDGNRRQYRSVLSFLTTPLPDNAVITKATLKVKLSSSVGKPDVAAFNGFLVDLIPGFFGTKAFLRTADFQAPGKKTVGPFIPTPSDGWYSFDLSEGNGYINKLASAGGLTQLRLRFKLDDNNNRVGDYLNFFSGDSIPTYRPILVIQYYVP